LKVECFLRRWAGGMPDCTGKSSLQVGFRHPEMMRNLAFKCGCSGTKLGRRIPQHCRPGPALKFAEQRHGHPRLSQPGGVRSNYGL